MKQLTWLVLMFVTNFSARAQSVNDKATINKLCGCFDVEFKYAETFSPNPNYMYHERDETSAGLELALPIEISDKKIVIQHLLIVGQNMIVKHWREEWTYENPVLWKYAGERTWVKEILPADKVKGKWTQTVWEVSDEPRYQGFSQFVEIDNKIIWQNTTDAPLPRREYSVRNDYNVLKRTNRLNINDSGYLHEQDNQKIIRSNGMDQLLVEEKGQNIYKRVNEKECAAAKEYWEKNKDYWGRVRKAWADYIASQNVLSLKTKVDGKMLHEYLNTLAREYATAKVNSSEIEGKIKIVIAKFFKEEGIGSSGSH